MQDDKVPMIPKHQHQAEMMHMSWTIRWLVIGIIIGFVCMLLQAFIFVNGYTSRTERWLQTYDTMMQAHTEGTHEEDTAGALQ